MIFLGEVCEKSFSGGTRNNSIKEHRFFFSSFKHLKPRAVRSDSAGSGPKNPVLPFQLPRGGHTERSGGGGVRLGDRQLPLRELHKGNQFLDFLQNQSDPFAFKSFIFALAGAVRLFKFYLAGD